MATKIQFGAGANLLEGWLNTEINSADITKPLKFDDNSTDEILAEHVAEHVSTPDFFRFLLECKRILKPGGVLWLSMPVLDYILDGDHARDLILGHGHQAAYTQDSLSRICHFSAFSEIVYLVDRPAIFGHWKQIGEERDELESFRLKLTK